MLKSRKLYVVNVTRNSRDKTCCLNVQDMNDGEKVSSREFLHHEDIPQHITMYLQ